MDLLAYLPRIMTAYAILIVAVASPGPAVALLLGLSLSQGRTSALAASLGIAVGAALLALATTRGLGLVMEQVAWLSTLIRMAGIGYLLWLAVKAFRRAAQPPVVGIATVRGQSRPSRAFLTGLMMQLTNPKAIVFWLAIATVDATRGAPVPVVALFLIGAFLISLTGHAAYALLLSSRPFRLAYDRARRSVEMMIGGFLTYAAFRLAIERN